MAEPDGVAPLNFDTAGFSDDETRRLCTAHLSDIVGGVTLEASADALAGLRGVLCRLADLSVMTCFFPPSPLRLLGAGKAGSGRVLMLRSMEGPLVVEQDGRRVETATGDFLFASGEKAFSWELPEGGRLDCGSLPARAFAVSPETLERLMLRPIPKSFPPLQLLITYGAYLLMRGPHSGKEAEMASVHFNEILPLVVAYLEGPQPVAAADRLSPVKAHIDAHLADGDLDITAVAAVLGVTPRYVQKLFQQEGTTFSKFLLERRLVAAKKLLLDAAGARPISGVAYEVGFGDLSYFNRTFRKRYGMAPSDIRKAQGG